MFAAAPAASLFMIERKSMVATKGTFSSKRATPLFFLSLGSFLFADISYGDDDLVMENRDSGSEIETVCSGCCWRCLGSVVDGFMKFTLAVVVRRSCA